MSTARRALAGAAALSLVAAALALTGGGGRSAVVLSSAWTAATPTVQSITLAPLLPGGGQAIAVEGTGAVVVLGLDGRERARRAIPHALTLATGDLDGDGVQEIVVAAQTAPVEVTAFDGALAARWVHRLAGVSRPVRVVVADLDGDGRGEVVMAEDLGGLVALGPDGRALWNVPRPAGKDAEPRGLGLLRGSSGALVVVVLRRGDVHAYDARGRAVWSSPLRSQVRRVRFLDGDGDGAPEAHVGLEDGRYFVVDPAGKSIQRAHLDSGVSEIRRLELDGDPAGAEVATGSKDGQVFVVRPGGVALDTRISGKITGLGGVDVDGDGRDELFVGTEGGEVAVVDKGGRLAAHLAVGGKVERILAVPGPEGNVPVVGAGTSVRALRLTVTPPPSWHSAPVAALLGLLAIGVALAAVRAVGGPPSPAAGPEAHSISSARAAYVRQLIENGAARPDYAANRLAELEQREAQSPRAPSGRPAPPSPPPPPARRR